MNKLFAAGSIAAIALAVSGCDLVRFIAGRPTSSEIARAEKVGSPSMEKEDSTVAVTPCPHCSHVDTLPSKADSPRALYSLKIRQDDLRQTAFGLEYDYYVLIGTFKERSYADAQVQRALKAGYDVVLIPFSRGGSTAVAVNPTDDIFEAMDLLARVRAEAFCPRDAFIMAAK